MGRVRDVLSKKRKPSPTWGRLARNPPRSVADVKVCYHLTLARYKLRRLKKPLVEFWSNSSGKTYTLFQTVRERLHTAQELINSNEKSITPGMRDYFVGTKKWFGTLFEFPDELVDGIISGNVEISKETLKPVTAKNLPK